MPSSAEIPWLELELTAAAEQAPFLELALDQEGFEGWVVEAEEPELRWVHYLAQQGDWPRRLETFKAICAGSGARVRQRGEIRDQDWAENWKAFYHPMKVGERVVVCPSWEQYQAEADEVVVELDPGSAFGTGYHETTRLCLALLERFLPQESVLDYGTGSGILSIAALKLGAKTVTAVDFDPVAVAVCRENLEKNGFGNIEVLEASTPPQGRSYPLVVANITAKVLLEVRESLLACCEDILILSGIIDQRADEVVKAFVDDGFELLERRAEGEWVCLCLRRR